MTNISDILRRAIKLAKPPPKLTVSEWADRYRKLSKEASSEPGQWMTARAEYQRGILDAVSDPDVHTIVVMSSAQVGKTELLLNVIGYYSHQDPSPMLLLQPTLEMAEAFSKDRLAPMVRDTGSLTSLYAPAKSKGSGNTLRHKTFHGGHITMAGANSPASLASRPIRVLLMDEVDRYPYSAGTEGDPVNLAIKRTTTFHNRKIILTSTPTIKDASRIEMAYNESDKRQYWVKCRHCGEYEIMSWGNVHWPDGEPEKAAYTCGSCGAIWSEKDRMKAIASGRWTASAESNGVVGFHLSELLSPWSTPAQMAINFVQAKRSPDTLKTWVNTSLGETWEEKGDQADPDALISYAENYDRDSDLDDVLMLTSGADVQKDRVEVQIVGWGAGGVPWVIGHHVIYGDPTSDELWREVDQTLSARYCGMMVAQSYIDSGYATEHVYRFTKKRHGRRVFPIKGEAGLKELVSKPKQTSAVRAMLVKVGIDPIKRALLAMLRKPGTAIHFSHTLDDEWFRQLTAEKMIVKKIKGFDRLEFVKTRERNEALDCFVYAYAAMIALNPNWTALEKQPEEVPKIEEPPRAKPPIIRRPMRSSGSGFAKRW